MAKDLVNDEAKSPCLKCKDYNKCPYGEGKEWYTYGEIRWCPFQVIWIIENAEILHDGKWPPPLGNSSYIDSGILSALKGEPFKVKAFAVVDEFDIRFRTTREAGEALVGEVVNAGITIIKKLSRPARRALMYIKGERRKTQTYSQWRRNFD